MKKLDDLNAEKINNFLERRTFLIRQIKNWGTIIDRESGGHYKTDVVSDFNNVSAVIGGDVLKETGKTMTIAYEKELDELNNRISAMSLLAEPYDAKQDSG